MSRYQIIERLESDVTQPETGIIIYPSILFVVTNEKISEIYELAGADANDEEENTEEILPEAEE